MQELTQARTYLIMKIVALILLASMMGLLISRQDLGPVSEQSMQASLPFMLKSGQPAYINFWAMWCEPCLAEMPIIAKMATEFKDVRFILINLDPIENKSAAVEIQKKLAPDIEAYYPSAESYSETALANHYQISALPFHIFINKQGQKVDAFNARIDTHPERFKDQLLQLLVAKPADESPSTL